MKSRYDFLRPLTAEEFAGLRADINANGQQLPIIRDQDGVTLDGHHRERVLRELRVPQDKWKVEVRKFANNDERMSFVISANHHRRQSTPEDRKRLAEHLFSGLGWTQQRIAKELGVSQATVSGDLVNLSTTDKLKPAKTDTNPKGAGRPKGSKVAPQPRGEKAQTREERVAVLHDAGLSAKEIAAEVKLGERAVHQALEHVQIARDAAAKARKEPVVTIDMLSMSERKKAEAWLRRTEREFEVRVEQLVRQRMRKEIDEIILPHYYKKQAEYEEVVAARRGVWTQAEYKSIQRCLHPDSRNTVSTEVLKRAFELLEKRKLVLLKEEEMPTKGTLTLPRNYADWERRRAEVSAQRKARRQQGRDVPARR